MSGTSMISMDAAQRRSHLLNSLALLGVSFVLLFAFAWQWVYKELPCPLCLLQRAGFVLAGIGLLLNVRFGASPLHYAVVLASALAGSVASVRQILLHIAPGDPGYGTPFLGLHFYTWSLLGLLALVVFCTLMLALDRQLGNATLPGRVSKLGLAAMWLFLALVTGNAVSTTLECGFGSCPDNPVDYQGLR